MNKLLLALLLSTASLVRAVEPAYTGGCEAPITGSYTVVLNNATVTAASVGITVGASAVVYVKSTGTAGTQLAYQFSDDNTNWAPAENLPHGAWCFAKKARYMRFMVTGVTTGTGTVKYYLATSAAPAAPVSGTLDQGTPGASSWPVSVTAAPVMRPGSFASAAWSTHTSQVYGTFTAGINGPYMFCLAPSYGGAAIRLRSSVTVTSAPSDIYGNGAYIPTTTTGGVCYGPYGPGVYQWVIGAGASTVSGTAEVFPVN